MRVAALVLAALLVVPAALVLLRPHRISGRPDAAAPRRPIDLVWAAVPVVLLIVLAAYSIAA